jgi:tRNA (guanine37-N1)-methyltransferase
MRVDVVTIFPEYLAPLDLSLLGKARQAGILDVAVHDLRTFTHDRHRTVDDAPLGGGAGMVMRPEPWGEALDHVLSAGRSGLGDPDAVPTLLVPSPAGEPFTQALARELAGARWLAFACGRYEGIDERVLEQAATVMPVRPLSLGDYVLNGGEVAVLAVVEAVARLLPGVLGNAESLAEESHENGLLEYPVYTRPASWRGRDVPPVLLSGHHAQVRRWRRNEQLRRTAARRPDLVARLDPAELDAADLAVLAACGWGLSGQGRLVPEPPAVADWTTVPPAGHALPQGGEAPWTEPPDAGGRHP